MDNVVLVSGLPDDFTTQDVRQRFSNVGNILEAEKVLSKSAYLKYSTSQEAESARRTKYTVNGKKLRVCLHFEYLQQKFLDCPHTKSQNAFEIIVREVFFQRLTDNVQLLKTVCEIINRDHRRLWLRRPNFIGITSLENSVKKQAAAAKRFEKAFISHRNFLKFDNTERETHGNENGLLTVKPVEIIVPQVSSEILKFYSSARVVKSWHEKYEGINISLDKEQASVTFSGPGCGIEAALNGFVKFTGTIGKFDIQVSEHVAKMFAGEDLKAWVQQTIGSIDTAHHWEIDKTIVSVIAQKDDHSLFRKVFQTAFREHDTKHADAQNKTQPPVSEEVMQGIQIPRMGNKQEYTIKEACDTNIAHKHERDLKNTALKKSENTSVVETNLGEENNTNAHEQNNKQLGNDLHVFDVGPEPLDPESKDDGQTEKDLQSNTAEIVTEMSMNETEDMSENTDDTLSLTSFQIFDKTEDQEKEELNLSDSETVCGHSNDSRCDQGNQQKDVSVEDENSGDITWEPLFPSIPGSTDAQSRLREVSQSGSIAKENCAGVTCASDEQPSKTIVWEQLHCLNAEQLVIVAGNLGISNSKIADLKARFCNEGDFRSNLIERCSSAASIEQLCHALVLLIQSDCTRSHEKNTDSSVGATSLQLGAKPKIPVYDSNSWLRESARSSGRKFNTMYDHSSAGFSQEANACMAYSRRPTAFSAFSGARKLDGCQLSSIQQLQNTSQNQCNRYNQHTSEMVDGFDSSASSCTCGFHSSSFPTEQDQHGAWSRQLSEPSVRGEHISSSYAHMQTDLMKSSSMKLAEGGSIESFTNVQGTESSQQQVLKDLHDMELSMTARMENHVTELFSKMENRMEKKMLVLSHDVQEECEQMFSLRMRAFKMQIRKIIETKCNQFPKQMDMLQVTRKPSDRSQDIDILFVDNHSDRSSDISEP